MCINGSGISNSWLKRNTGEKSYDELNALAAQTSAVSDGLLFFPFGNGSGRMFNNSLLHAHLFNLDFNTHHTGHLARAFQEGVVFSLNYGFQVFSKLGVGGNSVRAGKSNLFLSEIFRNTFVNALGLPLQLFDTNGAEGAARGAAVGANLYSSVEESF